MLNELLADAVAGEGLAANDRGAHRELVADRIKFDVQDDFFEAAPFLDPFVAGTLLGPRF